ncbi:tripartite tricarboxylate transporter TctB family protein [Marinomonas flavescens]|uniref:tripartite tricarboxylate transporter TctB family protein n=1 Tax=Marinomonas flavescens TaxID=2529379 RepID=UPI0010555B67|nr:tripartite tricarboxylate transporter TctB family protein [Marinomonas flavescens]
MKKGDVYLALMFAILALVFGKLSLDLYSGGRSGVGASQWPLMICIVILIGSILVFINYFRNGQASVKAKGFLSRDEKRVAISILTLILYFFSVMYVGFFVSSLAMLFVLITYYGNFKWYISLICALLIASTVYFVFSYLLNVSFKFGVLF